MVGYTHKKHFDTELLLQDCFKQLHIGYCMIREHSVKPKLDFRCLLAMWPHNDLKAVIL